MSFAGLLVHSLAIVTPSVVDPDSVDEYGHPVRGADETVTVRGMVQPRTQHEIALASQGGVEVGTHAIFLLPRRISSAAYIRDEPSAGRRFEIMGIHSYEYGTVPHLEVDVKLVGSPEGPTTPGS